MKKIVMFVGLALIACTLSVVGAQAATAATGSVSVKKISTKTAKYRHSVKVVPRVTYKGYVKYSSRTLTVKKGKKTIAKNRTSVNLKAGKYKVTSTVRYRTFYYRTTTRSTNVVAYPAWAPVPVTCTIKKAHLPDADNSPLDTACTGNFNGTVTPATSGILHDQLSLDWDVSNGSETRLIRAGATAGTLVNKSYATTIYTNQTLYRTKKVTERHRVYSGLKTKSLKQTLKIKQGKKPGRTSPNGWNCPSWAPIKGNASSGIYHVRSGAFYTRTNPEVCFSSESAARKAGYRKSKR